MKKVKLMKTNFYNLQAELSNGELFEFEQLKGKVVLLVNTASKCGFTKQYKGLEDLYKKYKDCDFIVLGFPCDQFANQEPGSDEEIALFCELNFGVTFPLFKKIEVNGKNTHPVYIFLKEELPGITGKTIKWNFAKFLIDKNGNPVRRFSPFTKPEKLEKLICELLSIE